MPREGEVNLPPEVDKYQVVVARSGYLDRMTFHIALVDESIDKALLKGRLERDIQDTLNLKGEIEFVGRGVIFDKHHKIKDEGKWGFFKGPPVVVISVIGPYVREKPKISGFMFSALAQVGVNSIAISTSISSVSCVVDAGDTEAALDALKQAFVAPQQVKKRPGTY